MATWGHFIAQKVESPTFWRLKKSDLLKKKKSQKKLRGPPQRDREETAQQTDSVMAGDMGAWVMPLTLPSGLQLSVSPLNRCCLPCIKEDPKGLSSKNSPTLRLVQFRSVQSLTHVQLLATSWTAAHQASLSITNSWSLLKLRSIE